MIQIAVIQAEQVALACRKVLGENGEGSVVKATGAPIEGIDEEFY